jgi:VWFA-related protein
MNQSPARRAAALMCILFLSLQATGQPQQRGTQVQQPPALSGQQSATQPQNVQQTPPLKVSTRLVQVNVIATDKSGKPVTDLTKVEFTLRDQGKPQEISYFSLEKSRAFGPAEGAPNLPANTYTNRLELKSGVPSAVTVILIDALNTRFTDRRYAQSEIAKYLSKLQPDDEVALYVLSDNLFILHDFTSRTSALIESLSHENRGESWELLSPSPLARTFRYAKTYEALEAIANHVRRLPGRKNLIWVTAAFPALPLGSPNINALLTKYGPGFFVTREMRAVAALNDANVAVYPVDARGLITYGISASDANDSANVRRGGVPPLSATQPIFDTMRRIADNTGGRAYINANDIAGSIRQAVEDSKVTYVLGYYPTHGQWDGRFRQIKIERTRNDVHLRYRIGYFASPDVRPHLQEEQDLLSAAMNSPVDFTALGMQVQVDPENRTGARTVKIRIQVEAREIAFKTQEDRWVGELDVYFYQRDAGGADLSSEGKQIAMEFSRERHDEIVKKGIVFDRDLPLAEGAKQLKVIVRDPTSSAIGTVTIALDKVLAEQGQTR